MKINATAVVAFTLGAALCSTASAFAPSGRAGVVRTVMVQKNQVLTSSSTAAAVVFGVRKSSRIFAASDDDDDYDDYDDDAEPLSKGIDSVSWLPTVAGASPGGSFSESDLPDGVEILPLFPLGGIVYTPNSEHVLNIFEPRYRQMYTDILMNGTKRFVVCMSHPQEKGRFAQTGVLFELEDLKEVSEQTNDQIKYICNHKVTGRVKLSRVLNPEAWENRDTYLKVEGTIMDDTGKDEADSDEAATEAKDEPGMSNDAYSAFAAAVGNMLSKPEKDLKRSFADLVDIQHDLEEDVRFTKASISALAVADGAGEDGLWQTIRLWQAYADQRLVARQNELQKDFQDKLQEFLKKDKGMKEDELPSAISFQDLSPALQKEVQDLQKRMATELEPLILESTLTMQKILEAEDHAARCELLQFFIDAERKRLKAKKTLLGMFSEASSAAESIDDDEDDGDEGDESTVDAPSSSSSAEEPKSMFDDPDAFQ
jgi:Lon protease-like protein